MSSLSALYRKIEDGLRISPEEALLLFQDGDLLSLGRLADGINKAKHGGLVGYVIDRNINYTNVCVLRCKFCALRRDKGAEGSWEHTYGEIDEKIEELLENNGTQILMQGGHHPEWKLDYYTNLVRHIREKFPTITVHAFSPPELDHISRLCKIPYEDTLKALKEAGLHSIPGGGAEILVDSLPQQDSDRTVHCET